MTTVNEAIEVLNRIHKADPTVLPALIFHRVECNHQVAEDKTVQVGTVSNGGYEVGILGIINGIFGVDENGWGHIYANFDDEGTLVDFSGKRII
jgi:hypothetical protein